MGDPKDNLGFWFRLLASILIATVISLAVGVINLMIVTIIFDVLRSSFTSDFYWVLGYSFVVWVISWIVSFGYLMGEK